MSRTKSISGVLNTQQKLTDLQSKMKQLQEQEKALQEKISVNLSTLLSNMGALSIPQETLIGGILHVISSHKSNSSEAGEWQQAGRQFLENKKPFKRKSSSINQSTQRGA